MSRLLREREALRVDLEREQDWVRHLQDELRRCCDSGSGKRGER